MSGFSLGHVASDRIGEAAQHSTLEFLRPDERRHVETCERCKQLYAGYRLTDRLLAASWRQAPLPAATLEAIEKRTLGERLAGVAEGISAAFGSRALVPMALAACLAIIVGLGVLLPMMMPSPPAASPSHEPRTASVTAAATPTASATGHGVADGSPLPGQTGGGPAGSPIGATPAPTQAIAATPAAGPSAQVAAIGGWPVAWAPDGGHFMTSRGSGWSRARQIQVGDASGHPIGTFTADAAVWVDANTIAATTHSTSSAGGSGGFGGSGGSGGFGGHNPGPGGGSTTEATVTLLDLRGHTTGTIAAHLPVGGPGFTGATLLGSGSGYAAIATQGNWGTSQSTFAVWDGAHLSATHAGVPIAFSRDGKRIAVLHPSGGPGGGSSGWLEIVSASTLNTISDFPRANVRLAITGDGPGYLPDAAFSPSGLSLLVSGTLVDLSRGSVQQVGEGGWLADGTLVTSGKGGVVLLWQGGHSATDGRFAAGGSISVSRRGDVIEYFGDGRKPLLLKSDGTLEQLNLNGIASIDDASMAPDGDTVALTGRASNGSRVTAVALLF